MTGTAILCSGQGAQSPGMFDLLADAPEAAAVFEAAKAALDGRDPRDLVRQAGEDELHADKAGQVLCCTQAMAAWAVLGGLVPHPLVAAGYSVGELAAWGVAGVLDARTVLGLAAERASLMDAATEKPAGLLAVRGLSRPTLEPLCRAHGCHVAIVNAPDQMLAGGTRASLDALARDAKAHGASVTTIPVAVASHTPLLRRASERFRTALGKVKRPDALPSGVRLLSGIDGDAVFDLRDGLDKLARQVQQTVDWAACMDACRSSSVTRVVELGPGNALARMMQAAAPDSKVHSLSEFHSLEGVKRWLGESRD